MEDMELDRSFNLSSQDISDLDTENEDIPTPTLCRETQSRQLLNVFGTPDKRIVLPCALFLWGPPSSGKTTVIGEALKAAHVERYVTVSGYELVIGQNDFFDEILNELNRTEGDVDFGCGSILQFFDQLKCLEIDKDERVVIVIDNVERLRFDQADTLSALLLTQEETGLNICIVLCSNAPPVAYTCISGMKIMPIIHFPQYAKEEILEIIRKEFQQFSKDKFFEQFLKTSIDRSIMLCRDVRKLSRIFELDYNKFKNNPNLENVKYYRNLWKGIKELHNPIDSREMAVCREIAVSQSLPTSAQYILVAAYLASQNPVSTDKKFFMKGSTKQKKQKSAGANLQQLESSTKDFMHSRLIAIVAGLLKLNTDMKLTVTSGFLSTIPTLCNLGLIERVGSNPLNECKYRCKVDFDLVNRLASHLRIDLLKYLQRSWI